MKYETEQLMRSLEAENIAVADGFEEKLLTFSEFFTETSKTLNLTAIKQPHEVMIKHYYDSLWPLKTGLFPQNGKVIDVGCGGGFPSMPLKLARPDCDFLLLDSLQKRLTFLDNACTLLGLDKIATLHARAEEAARKKELRDSFDVCVSRAVARLNVLSELCLPFVKVGGVFLAYKAESDEETDESRTAIEKLSGKIEDVIKYELPEGMGKRTLVVIRKTAKTAPAYPRTTKAMSKNPL